MKRIPVIIALFLAMPLIAQTAKPTTEPPAPPPATQPAPPPDNVATLRLTIKLMHPQANVQSRIAKDQVLMSIDQTKAQIFQREAQTALAAAKK